MKTIVLASNNQHKINEFREILSDYTIYSLKDIGFLEDIVEDGNTFLENALIKAKAVHEFLQKQGLNYDIIADDSGLCVPSLGGEPGVYSARYAKSHDDQANRDKLLQNLENKEDRSAYFVCHLVFYHSDGTYEDFEGRAMGVILPYEIGKKDFGYDCLFLSDDLGISFGEASEEEKNSISHRGRAIQKLLKEIKKK